MEYEHTQTEVGLFFHGGVSNPSLRLMGISSTLHAVYDEIMNSMLSAAQDHVNLADALTSQVVEVLKSVGKKNEESRKKVLPEL